MNIAVVTLVADLIELALSSALEYNKLRREAEAEDGFVTLDDVRKIQEKLRQKQADLDAAIAAMPEEPPPPLPPVE